MRRRSSGNGGVGLENRPGSEAVGLGCLVLDGCLDSCEMELGVGWGVGCQSFLRCLDNVLGGLFLMSQFDIFKN